MSFFSFSKKKISSATLILDIGSKSVGGAIYERTRDGGAKVLYVGREQIAFQKELQGERLLTATLNALGTLLTHIEKYGVQHLGITEKRSYHVDKVTLVISSPWHSSETKLLSLNLSKPTVITKAMLEELLVTEEKSFEDRERTAQGERTSFEVLERKIIEVRLNGYATGKPYGKVATHVDINIFSSIVSSETLKLIKTSIERHFPVERLSYHTFSVVAFASLRDHFPQIENLLIVQVGGEVTDITIIKKGIIVETVSFPLGHNGLLRSLQKICGTHPHCTLEGVLALHLSAHIEDSDKAKVGKAIADTKTAWLQYFNSAISSFSEETFLPKDVFLFEEAPYASLFGEFLREAGASQFTITAEPFVVKVVDAALPSLFAETGKNVQLDPLLFMEANFSVHADDAQTK